MESSRNCPNKICVTHSIIKGGQNGVKSQRVGTQPFIRHYYKGGAKWSQVATKPAL